MSDTEPTKPSETKDTGFTPGNDSGTRWRNIFNILLGRMTDEGLAQFKKDRDDRYEKEDCAKCEKHRDYMLKYSPIIRFLRRNINQLGGDIHSGNVRCRRCNNSQEGGFDPNYGILLCANHLPNKSRVEDAMAHEMVHAYDQLRWKMEWSNNLRHAACAEIRASSLSGECRWTREFFGNHIFKIAQQHQECVRRRATLSLRARPDCRDDLQAAQMVNEVWDSCFADTRPFDDIYR